jgi:hypothetical protein
MQSWKSALRHLRTGQLAWPICLAFCASPTGCGIPAEQSAQFVPNDATPQCQSQVMCLNQRICDLSTASQPATWCQSIPRPSAVRAECDGGYTAITFASAGARVVTYFYLDAQLVAAVGSEDGGDGVACGPGGMPFVPPTCGVGSDLCADVGDAAADREDG